MSTRSFLTARFDQYPFENIDKLPEWAKVGVVVDVVGNAHRRLAALVERIVGDSPVADGV